MKSTSSHTAEKNSVSVRDGSNDGDYLEELLVVFSPRLRFHRHSLVDGVRNLL